MLGGLSGLIHNKIDLDTEMTGVLRLYPPLNATMIDRRYRKIFLKLLKRNELVELATFATSSPRHAARSWDRQRQSRWKPTTAPIPDATSPREQPGRHPSRDRSHQKGSHLGSVRVLRSATRHMTHLVAANPSRTGNPKSRQLQSDYVVIGVLRSWGAIRDRLAHCWIRLERHRCCLPSKTDGLFLQIGRRAHDASPSVCAVPNRDNSAGNSGWITQNSLSNGSSITQN